MQRQKLLIGENVTEEVEGFIESSVMSILPKGNILEVKLQHKDELHTIKLNGAGSNFFKSGAIPRIDTGEYIVLHYWKEKIFAVQVLGIGSTVKFAFKLPVYAYPIVMEFVPRD